MDICAVNTLSYEDFVDVFGNLVEKCPIIAAAVWSRRPFTSLGHLETEISQFIEALPEAGKEGIVRCHPDLAGRELQSGSLTRDSREEQSRAGLDSLGEAEAKRMARLNQDYKARFGFPFVICAGLNTKATVLAQLAARLRNERAAELSRAIEEVKQICHLRLERLVLHEGPNKL